MDIPIDDKAWQEMQIAVTGFDRATVYVQGQAPDMAQQKVNDDGVPLWDVFCTVQDGRRSTNFKVRMASVSPPGIDGIDRIRFGGLKVSTYPDGPRNIVTFSADTFALGQAPSVTRAEGKPPAPPAAEKKAA